MAGQRTDVGAVEREAKIDSDQPSSATTIASTRHGIDIRKTTSGVEERDRSQLSALAEDLGNRVEHLGRSQGAESVHVVAAV
jgi:hypothetical protein